RHVARAECRANLTSPGRLSPRLAAERLSSNCHVLGRPQPSTYTHVRLGLRPPSGLVSLAIWPGTLRGHMACRQCLLGVVAKECYGLTMRSISTRAPKARPVTPTQGRPGRRPALK